MKKTVLFDRHEKLNAKIISVKLKCLRLKPNKLYENIIFH